jgi:hypothetical protein
VIPPLMGCKWGCERFFDLSRLFSLTRARVRVRAKEVRPVHGSALFWIHANVVTSDNVAKAEETTFANSASDNDGNRGSRTRPSPADSVFGKFFTDRPNFWPAGLE